MLGSSGECLPVSRRKIMTGGLAPRSLRAQHAERADPRGGQGSGDSESASDSDEFHSAHSSLEGASSPSIPHAREP